MVQCKRCNIGEIKRRLKDRFNEHRRLVDKADITKPTTVSEQLTLNLTILTLTCSYCILICKPEEGWYGQPKY